jgi:hypothetical protein
VAILAGLAVVATHLLAQFPLQADTGGEPETEWVEADHVASAITLDLRDFLGAEPPRAAMRRHISGGGRRDSLVWGQAGDSGRLFAIELYRPGTEDGGFGDPFVGLSPTIGGRLVALAGGSRTALPSKFGAFAVVHASRRAGAPCVGFVQVFDAPRLHIAGLACERDASAAHALIVCALDRFDLLSAGGDVRLAGLFAQAALKRSTCKPGKPPAASAAAPPYTAWIDGAAVPAMRAGFVGR